MRPQNMIQRWGAPDRTPKADTLRFIDQGGNPVDVSVPCKERGRIYRDQIREALTDFERNWGQNLFFRDAVLSRNGELLAGLARLLDRYLLGPLHHLFGRDETAGTDYRTQCRDFDAKESTSCVSWLSHDADSGRTDSEALNRFRQAYPVAGHALRRVTRNFVAFINEVCRNIETDREDIGNAFFDGKPLQRLQRIEEAGGDLDRGGRQALRLWFELDGASAGSGHVMYKPSDVEIDYLLVGDGRTVGYHAAGGTYGPGQAAGLKSVSDLLNHFYREDRVGFMVDVEGREEERHGFAPETFCVPTYTILPRNPGSSLERDGEGALPIRTSYGYVECLSHEPEIGLSEGAIRNF
ncbi:MAG: DUF4135 domain-containing protein, partial [Verrucomicrobiota bacterium]